MLHKAFNRQELRSWTALVLHMKQTKVECLNKHKRGPLRVKIGAMSTIPSVRLT